MTTTFAVAIPSIKTAAAHFHINFMKLKSQKVLVEIGPVILAVGLIIVVIYHSFYGICSLSILTITHSITKRVVYFERKDA